ncbi:UDP-glucose/GDP-mannose dehydrogenase family protein [soil metagenome]
MRITIAGLGYVGLVTGACLAAWGHRVVGVDSNQQRLDALASGRLPFHEPRLAELVAEQVAATSLAFSADLATAAADADVVIVAVGTHDGNGGWQTDTIRTCLAELVPVMRDGAALVIRSTLPPDAVGPVGALVDAQRRDAGRPTIPLLLNPEFTREGRAVTDFQQPERVVLGIVSDPMLRGEAALREVYAATSAPILVMPAIDAALTKLGSNLFLATKISFANELAELCDAFGADVSTVVEGMSYDGRIGGSFLRAGVGFGGSCLPNQVAMTVKTAAQAGIRAPLMEAVKDVNDHRRVQIVQRAAALLDGTVRSRRIAVLGLTFKPDTDDLRDAPALDIGRGLIESGASVVAYDPMASARERAATLVPGLEVVDNAMAALRGVDAVILVTEWREFVDLDWAAIGAVVRRRVVIDGRNVLSGPRLTAAGFVYSSFGRGTSEPGGREETAAAPTVSASLGWIKR